MTEFGSSFEEGDWIMPERATPSAPQWGLKQHISVRITWTSGDRTFDMHLTYLLTHLLTPWCRVLLEKLTGLQLVKTFPAFHGTRRFITAFTSFRHLSLSWASPIQSIYPHPTSCRSILIISTHLRLGLPSGLVPSGFPTKALYTPFSCIYQTIIADCRVCS